MHIALCEIFFIQCDHARAAMIGALPIMFAEILNHDALDLIQCHFIAASVIEFGRAR